MLNLAAFLLPCNLLQRDDSRLFCRALAQAGVADWERWIPALWAEWGAQQRVWRPLRQPLPAPGEDGRLVLPLSWFAAEDTLQLVELGVGWTHAPGLLVSTAYHSGYLRLVLQGDAAGVELSCFGELNPHFAPGYKSLQQKGAAASAMAKRGQHDTVLARQQRELLERQATLHFAAEPGEVEAALKLILGLDRLAGRKPRITTEYEGKLIERAVFINRNHTPQRIESLLAWLLHQRADASVMQGAEAVLAGWEEYLTRSGL